MKLISLGLIDERGYTRMDVKAGDMEHVRIPGAPYGCRWCGQDLLEPSCPQGCGHTWVYEYPSAKAA